MSDTEILLTIVMPLSIGFSLGRWYESVRWRMACDLAEPIRRAGEVYRPMRYSTYLRLTAGMADPSGNGCCCEETPIQYRSRNLEE